MGIKGTNDTCDYQYECQSRCCNKGKCGISKEKCFIGCKKNKDCPYSNCCGDGHCVNDVICEGNKVNGDYCDNNYECVSELCEKNQCKSKSKDYGHCDVNQECKSGTCKNHIC